MQIYLEKWIGKLEFHQSSVINNGMIDNLINPRKLLLMQYLSEYPVTSFEFLLCISHAWESFPHVGLLPAIIYLKMNWLGEWTSLKRDKVSKEHWCVLFSPLFILVKQRKFVFCQIFFFHKRYIGTRRTWELFNYSWFVS